MYPNFKKHLRQFGLNEDSTLSDLKTAYRVKVDYWTTDKYKSTEQRAKLQNSYEKLYLHFKAKAKNELRKKPGVKNILNETESIGLDQIPVSGLREKINFIEYMIVSKLSKSLLGETTQHEISNSITGDVLIRGNSIIQKQQLENIARNYNNLHINNPTLRATVIKIVDQYKDDLNDIRTQLAKAASGEYDEETIDNIKSKIKKPVPAMPQIKNEQPDEIKKLIRDRIEKLRPKLLDLTTINPLISARFKNNSATTIRVVDELPDQLFEALQDDYMKIVSLPPIESTPIDESTKEFKNALSEAIIVDDDYIEEISKIDDDNENYQQLALVAERKLKDKLREHLGLPQRQTSQSPNLKKHAEINNISPSYNLPAKSEKNIDGRHSDSNIQTLLLPDHLQRKLSSIYSTNKTWEQEAGILVLQCGFGFVEWEDVQKNKKPCFAPLILLPIEITKNNTPAGIEFKIKSRGETPQLNLVLCEKMKDEFGVELPEYNHEEQTVEDYLETIEVVHNSNLSLKPKRQVAFGVFPSQRLAMFKDLETTKWQFEDNEIIKNIFAGSENKSLASPLSDEEPDDLLLGDFDDKERPILVQDGDSSQFAAIKCILKGDNMALEGPPGSGKSQTIVNVIANCLAIGKKVLFVAEKTAALEVVLARLKSIGLGDFALPLQATKASKGKLIKAIRDRLEYQKTISEPGNHQDKSRLLRKAKNIQEYIDFISRKYGNTGLIFHDIIGNKIKQDSLLDGMPVELKEELTVENFNENLSSRNQLTLKELDSVHLDELAEKCQIYEDTLSERLDVADFWKEVNPDAQAPHIKDKYISSLKELICKIQEINAIRSVFKNKGFLDQFEDVRMEFSSVFNDFLDANLDKEKILFGIGTDDCAARVDDYLASRNKLELSKQCLEDKVKDISNPELLKKLRVLNVTLQSTEFNHLCKEVNIKITETKKHVLLQLKNVLEYAVGFEDLIGNLGECPIKELIYASNICKKTLEETLDLRRKSIEEKPSHIIIKNGDEKCKSLISEQEGFHKIFRLNLINDTADLQKAISVIQKSNIFSIFSLEYWKTKSYIKTIYKIDKYNKIECLSNLVELSSHLSDVEIFASNKQLKDLLGQDFNGIHTNFTPYHKLIFYYQVINQIQGNDCRILKVFLQEAPTSQIKKVPIIETLQEGVDTNISCNQLKIAFEKTDKSINLLEKCIDTISLHCDVFINTDFKEINSEYLIKLINDLENHEKEQLNILNNEFINTNFKESLAWPNKPDQRTIKSINLSKDILANPNFQLIVTIMLSDQEKTVTEYNELVSNYYSLKNTLYNLFSNFNQLTGLSLEFNKNLYLIEKDLIDAVSYPEHIVIHANLSIPSMSYRSGLAPK